MARDIGRLAVTDDRRDAYRFRTPFLRNVEKTAPYGHDVAFQTLEAIIRHHADPIGSLKVWTPKSADLPVIAGHTDEFAAFYDERIRETLLRSISMESTPLNAKEVAALTAFLGVLTAPENDERFGQPDRVPSGLALK